MTLFSGLGVLSTAAAPFADLDAASHIQVGQVQGCKCEADSPTQLCERFGSSPNPRFVRPYSRFQARLRRYRAIDRLSYRAAIAAFHRFNADDGWAIASHIALSTLMALFPFLIVLGTLARFLGANEIADDVDC
jgi:hypothetical protein